MNYFDLLQQPDYLHTSVVLIRLMAFWSECMCAFRSEVSTPQLKDSSAVWDQCCCWWVKDKQWDKRRTRMMLWKKGGCLPLACLFLLALVSSHCWAGADPGCQQVNVGVTSHRLITDRLGRGGKGIHGLPFSDPFLFFLKKLVTFYMLVLLKPFSSLGAILPWAASTQRRMLAHCRSSIHASSWIGFCFFPFSPFFSPMSGRKEVGFHNPTSLPPQETTAAPQRAHDVHIYTSCIMLCNNYNIR